MTNGENEPTNLETLGWDAAYASNGAHDTLQAAQDRLDKLNEIAALSLDGVIVEESTIEEASTQIEQAQRDFDTLGSMAGAVAMMEDSPLAPTGKASVTKAAGKSKAPAKSKAETVANKAKSDMQERMDAVLVSLLEHGGRIEAIEGQNASRRLMEQAGISGYKWTNTRTKLNGLGMLKYERVTPSSKILTAISVNMDTLHAWSEAGRLSPRVQQAFEKLQIQEEQEKKPGRQGADPDFLEARVGEEQIRHDEELKSIRTRHRPSRRRDSSEISAASGKSFTFGFSVDDHSLYRTITVRQLQDLPTKVRMLLGFGQVNHTTSIFIKRKRKGIAMCRGWSIRV